MRACLCLLVIGCGGGVAPSADCLASSCGPHAYQFCRAGVSCSFVTDDGQRFDCKGCDGCAGAAQAIDAWCTGAPASPIDLGAPPDLVSSGTNTGGTTTGVTMGAPDLRSVTANDLGSSGTLDTACISCFASERAPGGSCTSQYDACVADTGCAAILQCAESCVSLACIEACTGGAPASSLGPAEALYACECQWCATPCSGSCGAGM
jgi:hypothetical protein